MDASDHAPAALHTWPNFFSVRSTTSTAAYDDLTLTKRRHILCNVNGWFFVVNKHGLLRPIWTG
jgi:hypothetical protein